MHIPKICITGDGGDNHKTAIAYIHQRMNEYGWHVMHIPHTPTALGDMGIGTTTMSANHISASAVRLQKDVEKLCEHSMRTARIDRGLILCESGIPELGLGLTQKEFESLLKAHGIRSLAEAHQRYQLVLCVTDTNVHAEKLAIEMYPQARAIDTTRDSCLWLESIICMLCEKLNIPIPTGTQTSHHVLHTHIPMSLPCHVVYTEEFTQHEGVHQKKLIRYEQRIRDGHRWHTRHCPSQNTAEVIGEQLYRRLRHETGHSSIRSSAIITIVDDGRYIYLHQHPSGTGKKVVIEATSENNDTSLPAWFQGECHALKTA